jgi:hypothetical protein
LLAKHAQEQQQAHEASQRALLEQQHAKELKALQDRQAQEREAAAKRQREAQTKKGQN